MRRIKVRSWTTNRFRLEVGRTTRTRAIPADRLRKTSWSEFKARNSKHYTLKSVPEFIYFDGHKSKYPHLVLCDHAKEPLFMLGYLPAVKYSTTPSHIKIRAIQRNTPKSGVAFSPELDAKRRTDEFKARTGMNPEDFLLSEFIHQNRAQLLRGVKMYLEDDEQHHTAVARLRDRFCRKNLDKILNSRTFSH